MSTFARHKYLLLILIGAFGLRLIAAVGLQWYLDTRLHRAFLLEGDAQGYWDLARQIATGGPYEINQPPRKVLRMPGFPAVVASGMVIAERLGIPEREFLITRCLLAGVGAMACGMVYLLGKELFDARVGLLAAAITAVSPVMVGFSVEILSETLFAATLVLSLWLMAKLRRANQAGTSRRPAWLLSVFVGAAVALACYARPSWLLAGPCFALLHLLTSAHRMRALCEGCCVMLGLALALAPWTYRNYQATGYWVATTLWLGPSLYDGLNPNATGDSDLSFYDRDRLMENGMSEYDVNKYYTKLAVDYAKEHPDHAIRLAFAKFVRFWKPWPNAAQFDTWPACLAVSVFFIPTLLFALRGLWACRRNVWTWGLTLGPALYFSALHSLFVGSLRYRLPVEYPLCVLTAFGLLVMVSGRARPNSVGESGSKA